MFGSNWLPWAALLQVIHALPQQIPLSAPAQDPAERYAGHSLVRLQLADATPDVMQQLEVSLCSSTPSETVLQLSAVLLRI